MPPVATLVEERRTMEDSHASRAEERKITIDQWLKRWETAETAPGSGLTDPCAGVSCPGGEVCLVTEGRIARCSCPEQCPLDHAPVCASDGRTFTNECALRADACRTRRKLKVQYRGPCNQGLGIKRLTQQKLSQAEFKLLALTEGRVVHPSLTCSNLSDASKQYHPAFQPITENTIRDIGGFYLSINDPRPINLDNHNLYEKVPSLGVMSDVICNEFGNANPGEYVSRLTTATYKVTRNLIGYRNLSYRRPEAKTMPIECDITDTSFS
nr:uncharacterized protein LOC112210347 [Halyomorpha halys]